MKFIAIGEILARFSPQNNEKILRANSYNLNFGGAETNVAISLSNLGVDSSIFSVIPENSLADAAVSYLNSHRVDTSKIHRGGQRLGLYYLEEGVSIRPSEAIYDRKHSSISEVDPNTLDFDEILKGYDWLHMSGITPALSENCRILTKKALISAKKLGITVSFDPNFRGKLWSFETARDVLSEFMQYVDVLIGIEPIHLRDESGRELKEGLSRNPSFEDINNTFKKLSERYGFKVIAATVREVHSSSNNSLKAFMYTDGKTYESRKITFDILDRVGGGDAFTSGLIYALMEKMQPQKCVEFAVASSALKHTIRGDANISNRAQIESLMGGSFDISR